MAKNNIKEEIIKVMLGRGVKIEDIDKIALNALKNEDCILCGHPLNPSKRIERVADQILQKFLEMLPEEKKCILQGGDGKIFDVTKELGVGSIGKGYNQCLQDIKEKLK